MARRGLRAWLLLAGVYASGCALTGYDFGDYQRAAPGSSAAGEPSTKSTTTFGEATAGAPMSEGGAASEGGGANEGGATGDAGQGGAGAACEPRGCRDQSVECGVVTDGCGRALDCGGCLWWFLECRQNLCQFIE